MPQHDEHPWVLANMAHPRAPLPLFAAAGLLLLAALATAHAQEPYRGTAADQQACTDDVTRICNQFIPDEQRIVACLIQNRRHLSPACRAVFSRGPEAGKPRSRDGDARP
jgi:hypothetical protein